MYTDPWTEAELDLLREYYEEKGCKWDGWKELLPKRSPMSIRRKSNMLGLRTRAKVPRAKRTVYATGANECEHVDSSPRLKSLSYQSPWLILARNYFIATSTNLKLLQCGSPYLTLTVTHPIRALQYRSVLF